MSTRSMTAYAMARLDDLKHLYRLLHQLERKIGGMRLLSDCTGRSGWPARGVYFFFERGEGRSDSGHGPRVVRVGTHALNENSRTSLWNRLQQHRGTAQSGGGNHRGSIFRLLIGTALVNSDPVLNVPTWGQGSSATRKTRSGEEDLEIRVSKIIGEMPFLWVGIEDKAGADSRRGFIERNAIALLSNYKRPALDRPSGRWLGHYCDRERIRASGLWNSRHVDEQHDPQFLSVLESFV